MWATVEEVVERFRAETIAATTYDYRIYDVFDNGEFFTSAKLDLLVNGGVAETVEFWGSSEFADSCSAVEQALSYAQAWVETMVYSMEERLGPFGLEFEREQDERRGGGR